MRATSVRAVDDCDGAAAAGGASVVDPAHGWVLLTLLVLAWACGDWSLLDGAVAAARPEAAADRDGGDCAEADGDGAGGPAQWQTPALRRLRWAGAGALRRLRRKVDRALADAAESRRELEALLDSMQDAVVAVDAAGRIQWTNQRMQRLIPEASVSERRGAGGACAGADDPRPGGAGVRAGGAGGAHGLRCGGRRRCCRAGSSR